MTSEETMFPERAQRHTRRGDPTGRPHDGKGGPA